MTPLSRLLATVLVVQVLGICNCSSWALTSLQGGANSGPMPVNTLLLANKKFTDVGSGEITPVPVGSTLLSTPVLVPGQAAWVTVVTGSGHSIAGASVVVNGVAYTADLSGIAALQIPQVDKLTIAIFDPNKKPVFERKYVITSGGMLISEDADTHVFAKISELIAVKAVGPAIVYSPVSIEARQLVLILGKNFSGRLDEDQLVIDGLDAIIVAGSPAALLAVTPSRLSIGPVRELLVRSGDESSDIREVDVCRVELVYKDKSLEPGQKYRARLQVLGSNIPCLVEVDNRSSDAVSLTGADGTPLPAKTRLMTPGGEQNYLPVELSVKAKTNFDVDAHLLPDILGVPGVEGYSSDPKHHQMVKDLVGGEIGRLKRRLINVENRLGQIRERGNALQSEPSVLPGEYERLSIEQKNLSNRQARLLAMLKSCRVLFEALGATDEEFRHVLEVAGGGVMVTPPTISPNALPIGSEKAAVEKAAAEQVKVTLPAGGPALSDGVNRKELPKPKSAEEMEW
ncbi:MAG: hypothetical protein HY711_02140 [Candidatus Melainabacteria bacterium]|nr:hypothetical protein [Candidatus Melainabacteria bacterium]